MKVKKKLQILMHFPFIEQELLLSKKNNKKFNRGLFYFFSSHIFLCFSLKFPLKLYYVKHQINLSNSQFFNLNHTL